MWSSQNVRHRGRDPRAWRSVLPVSWDNCWEWAGGAVCGGGSVEWCDRWGRSVCHGQHCAGEDCPAVSRGI